MTKSVTNAPEVSALPRKGPEPHAAVSHEPQSSTESSRRVLQPIERISEVLFGLIMVLTITCSLSIAEADRKNVRAMLLGALGCNLAWGIIDGFMYLMACFSSRGQNISKLRALRKSRTSGEANQIIGEALPPLVMSVLTQTELDSLRQRLNGLPEPAERPTLAKEDWLGALAVFLLVSLSTFPVVLPFLLVSDARVALRVSNGIALSMLFTTGYAFGRHAGHRPLRTGLWMVLIGTGLVAITMALGG